MTEQQKKTIGIAIASLVLGISGFILLGPLGSIPAVICGHIARSKIRRDPEHLTGENMALAGLILGYIQIVLILVLATIAIPSFVKTSHQAQVNKTRSTISSLSMAIDLYELEAGSPPSSLEALLESDGSPNWNGPYLREKAVDAWGTPFSYNSDEGSASIISAGPDKTIGTSDDISNR